MILWRPLLAVCLLCGLIACASDQGFATRNVSRKDYAGNWPLIADDAVLACEPGGVPTVTVGGTSYSLDRAGEREAGPTALLSQVLADDPAGGKKDPAALRADALALCD